MNALPQSKGIARFGPWILLLALAALPFVAPLIGADYYVGFVRRMLIVTLAVASLNFLIGQGNLQALGHAGFFGVGAYTVVVMSDMGHANAWGMWGAAIVVTAVVAVLIGAVCFLTRGVYFIMISLAFAQMLYYVAVSLRTYGGDDGYTLTLRPSFGFTLPSGYGNTLYILVLAATALALLMFDRLAQTPFGRALHGIRDNEVRMRALGYPVYRLKLCAFAIAGAVAGLAGAMLAMQNSFVSPSIMHWTQSATFIVMVVIGGVGHRWGPLIGVVLWMALEETFRNLTDFSHWPMGILLVLVVFLAPNGIAALRRRAAA
jgi:branched-chain amino acid transport system permease protein